MAGTQSAQHSAQSNPMRAPVASKESEVRTNEDEPHEYIDVPRPLASLEGTLERGFGDVVALLKYLIGVVEKLSGKSPVESAHSRAKDGHEAGNMQIGTAPAPVQMLPPEDLVSPASVVNTQRNCEDLMEKTKELQAQRDQLAEQLSETRDKLASVTADSGRLRGIVFERLKEQEKSDQEIREAFTGLQQKIQKISMSGEIDIKKISKLGKPEDMQSWENLSGGERKNRIRGGVFNLLQRYILDYPCFGLEGFSIKDDVQERVGLTFNDFELAFINFERVLKELKLSSTAISEWRIATLKCVDQLKNQDQTSNRAANRIIEFLKPLRVAVKPGTSKLDKTILELCEQAFELRIKMRKSKENYKCEIPQTNQLAGQDQIAEAVAAEGQNNSQSMIAYTILGALTKQSEDLGKIVVLEKAQVVIY